MVNKHVEKSLNEAQIALQSLASVALMLADQLELREAAVADSIRLLAELADKKVSEAFRVMYDRAGTSSV